MRAAAPSSLDAEVVEAGSAHDEAETALAVHLLPSAGVPDLDLVHVPGDDHVTFERGEGAEVPRDEHPTLAIDGSGRRVGGERTSGLPLTVASLRLLHHIAHDPFELLGLVDGHAAVEGCGEVRARLELLPELDREDHPA